MSNHLHAYDNRGREIKHGLQDTRREISDLKNMFANFMKSQDKTPSALKKERIQEIFLSVPIFREN